MATKLTPKKKQFVALYMESGDAVAAWRQIFDVRNFADLTIKRKANELLVQDEVQEEIIAAKKLLQLQQAEAHPVIAAPTRDEVINIIREIATADASELSQIQMRNCRYCHGIDHKFQWHSPLEYARRCARIMDENAEARQIWEEQAKAGKRGRPPKDKPIPSDDGGYGFRFDGRPHPECPECLGEGHEAVTFADTRTLSGTAKRLFAGVKKTTHGLEIITRNQDVALKLLAEITGATKPDAGPTVNVQNNGGQVAVVVSSDPLAASREYQDLMRGDS